MAAETLDQPNGYQEMARHIDGAIEPVRRGMKDIGIGERWEDALGAGEESSRRGQQALVLAEQWTRQTTGTVNCCPTTTAPRVSPPHNSSIHHLLVT